MTANGHYPASCCADDADQCNKPFERACATLVYDTLNSNAITLLGVVIGFLSIQFISMVLACCLALSIH